MEQDQLNFLLVYASLRFNKTFLLTKGRNTRFIVRGLLMNVHEFRNTLICVLYAIQTQRTYNARWKRTLNANSQDKYVSSSVPNMY